MVELDDTFSKQVQLKPSGGGKWRKEICMDMNMNMK